jgi:hypothetical protein
VTTPKIGDGQQETISRLRAQNRRYRELIQNLSSVVEIVRQQLHDLQPSSAEHRAFERIDGEEGPLFLTLTPPSRVKNKLHQLLRPSRHADASELKPLVPNPGWKCLAVDQPRIRIGFTLFGMTEEAVEDAVREVEHRQLRSRDFTPVFVTDCPDLGPFRARGYVAEYIPASITSAGRSSRDKRRYLKNRIDLITAKWGLGKVFDLGSSHQ